MANDDTIDTLNKLIETCKDGEYGFRACAEHAQSSELKTVFTARADDCRRGASELQAAVGKLGGKAETGSTISGTLHRGWVNLKGAVTGDNDMAALNECERGEDVALDRYRDALKQTLPADIESLVRRQYEGAKRNHDQIRTLRDARRAAK